jgi:hypothetical protein
MVPTISLRSALRIPWMTRTPRTLESGQLDAYIAFRTNVYQLRGLDGAIFTRQWRG